MLEEAHVWSDWTTAITRTETLQQDMKHLKSVKKEEGWKSSRQPAIYWLAKIAPGLKTLTVESPFGLEEDEQQVGIESNYQLCR